jgi:hypothetical protein
MTHLEALEFLTRIGAEQTGPGDWKLTVGDSVIKITNQGPDLSPWMATPAGNEVDTCFGLDPKEALLDLGADLSDMATHCSSFGRAVTRLAL